MPVSFSERMGLRKARRAIQLDGMDEQLRTAIYNFLHDRFTSHWFVDGVARGRGYIAARRVWTELWYLQADAFQTFPGAFIGALKAVATKGEWNQVYDVLEFAHAETPLLVTEEVAINHMLERERSGYRIRNGMLIPISDDVELKAVEDALNVRDAFGGARAHIADALEKLGQRPKPDLRNAITEAVSAVESAARIVTGKPKATLADALKVLEKKHWVHPQLKEAWSKLYNYTSDEQGLRHAMTEDPNIDFPTAKYMVVSCAAFVNLLSTSPVL